MEDLIELVFDLLTFRSRKRGPLGVLVDADEQRVRLTLENEGKRKLAFAAVQCHDSGGKKHFPEVELAVRTALRREQPETLTIPTSELRSIDCQRIVILDTTGTAWPVDDFDPTVLGASAS